jgi:hypothetical protein
LDEVSFESSTDLNNAQAGTFTLATLSFTGLAPGTSTIDFTLASLSDEQGQALIGFSTTGGSIQVMGAPAHVPDVGSTALLLIFGIASLSAFWKCPQTAMRWASGGNHLFNVAEVLDDSK